MSRRSASRSAFAVAAFVASTSFAQGSPETSEETSTQAVEQCVAQHDSARQLRLQEQWPSARAAMLGCADQRCPLAIAADCRAWLDELARVLPTLLVVVELEDPAQRSLLRVELDGAPLQLPERPAPLELTPGPHRLRLQLGSGAPVERSLVLQKGEKNHVEQVRFAHQGPEQVSAPAPGPVATRPIPPVTYWLSAGALVAYASSAAFLSLGVREHRDAQVQCAPTCDSGTRRSIETKLVLADAAGGIGIALTGLALFTYLRRPLVGGEARASGPVVAASGQGATLFWRGQF
jgi:hypothetical protein